jgi:predicted ATPase
MAKRFILSGAPGAGKTAVLRHLEIDGFGVVEEAATDVIALDLARGVSEPWREATFIQSIVDLQRERQIRVERADGVHFFDRSPICTWALATFLNLPASAALQRELARIDAGAIYEKKVFFIQLQGYVTPTPARRISLEDALAFERVHEDAYRAFGYDLVAIAPGGVSARAARIKAAVGGTGE